MAKEQRQWAQARDYLLQDLTISIEFNDEHGVGITLGPLARRWQAGGLTELPATVAGLLNITPAAVEATFTQLLANATPGSAQPNPTQSRGLLGFNQSTQRSYIAAIIYCSQPVEKVPVRRL